MQLPSTTQNATPWSFFMKFVECLLVSIAIVNAYYNTLIFYQLAPVLSGNITFFKFFNPALIGAGILFAICYPIYWHLKESKQAIDSGILHSWFRGVLRYWLSLEICVYGFSKIFGLQFGHSYLRDDSLVSSLSGFELTWSYFGYSYTMAVIIAMLQILGSILLLFRRTTFLGITILFPVMINILLIDVLYDIPFGATLNAALFTLGLLYLLLLRWKDLQTLFFRAVDSLPGTRLGFAKHLIRFSVVVYSPVLMYYATTVRSSQSLVGKWQVDELIKNGHTVNANAWLSDATAWKHIYLEQYGDITLSPNPYIIEEKRAQMGSYEYDSSKHVLKLAIWGNQDTLHATVTANDARHMQWQIISGRDTTLLLLSKVERTKHL